VENPRNRRQLTFSNRRRRAEKCIRRCTRGCRRPQYENNSTNVTIIITGTRRGRINPIKSIRYCPTLNRTINAFFVFFVWSNVTLFRRQINIENAPGRSIFTSFDACAPHHGHTQRSKSRYNRHNTARLVTYVGRDLFELCVPT